MNEFIALFNAYPLGVCLGLAAFVNYTFLLIAHACER